MDIFYVADHLIYRLNYDLCLYFAADYDLIVHPIVIMQPIIIWLIKETYHILLAFPDSWSPLSLSSHRSLP